MDNAVADKGEEPSGTIEKTPEDIPEQILKGVPEAQQEAAKAVYRAFILYERRFKGPLPPPEIIAGYEQILPGSANRIIAMAESQLKHRQAIEASIVQSEIQQEHLGLKLGFVLAAITIVGSIIAILADKQVAGLVTIAGATAALAAVFVHTQNQEQRQKSQIETDGHQAETSPKDNAESDH